VHAVISSSARTLHALGDCGHGMDDAAVQSVFRAVVVFKLQYDASCACWGFSTLADIQRINAYIRHSARCGFVPADLPVFEELCRLADETLFRSITSNPNYVLTRLVRSQSTESQNYDLQHRFHNLHTPARVDYLNDCSFIIRMLYSNPYY